MAQLRQHALQNRGKGKGRGNGKVPTEAELREHLAENAEVVDIAAEQLAHDQVGHSIFVPSRTYGTLHDQVDSDKGRQGQSAY